MASVDLSRHFLIAMPNMADPNFSRSLTYVCEHTEQGALGLVVNRPIDMTVGVLIERVGIESGAVRGKGGSALREPVYFGGPVQAERGFVLHRPLGAWQSTLNVNAEIGLTTSLDILEALARGEGPRRAIVALGYSGWAPGQLEEELRQNAWLTVGARDDILFDLPAEARLAAAMELLGVNFASLSDSVGHA